MAPRETKPVKPYDDLKRKKAFFKQRFLGFKKKVIELSVLCGNSAGFICYGPNNDDLHVWPKNPQTLQQIVAKFNEQSDLKRKKNTCDLNDFSHLEGFSVDELKSHLSGLESHLVGVKRQKIKILKKTIKGSSSDQRDIVSEDRHRVSENTTTADQKFKDMVSKDHLKVSDQKLDTKLGFGGVFDELGYMVRGSTSLDRSVSSFKSNTLGVPNDDRALGMEVGDYTRLDPITLGFSGGESELYPISATHNLSLGISCIDHVWDLEFSSTPPSLTAYADSFITNTCQTPTIYNWGNELGFETQPFMWE